MVDSQIDSLMSFAYKNGSDMEIIKTWKSKNKLQLLLLGKIEQIIILFKLAQ